MHPGFVRCRPIRALVVVSALAGAVVAAPAPVRAAITVAADTSQALPITSAADVVVDAQHGHVFISGNSQVVVTDLSGAIVSTISAEQGASGMALSADDSTLYVALSTAGAVSEIDTTTLTERSRTVIDTSLTPTSLALAGGTLWVGYGCTNGCGGVAWVDPSEPVSDHPVITGRYHGPPALASASPTASVLGVVDDLNPLVDVYDVTTTTPVLRGSTTGATQSTVNPLVAVSADGSTLLVTEYGHVTALRTSDLTSVATYDTLSWPSSLSFSPDGTHFAVGVGSQYGQPTLLDYALSSTVAVHGDNSDPTTSSHVAYGTGASTVYRVTDGMAGSTATLTVFTGLGADPAGMTLSVNGTSIGSGGTVSGSGRLSTTDGTSPAGQTVAVSRSGPGGLVTVASLPTATDGSFSFSDTPSAAGGYTYRATWAGDAAHSQATAAASVTLGSGPAWPAEPAAQSDHSVSLPVSDFSAMVVDNAHGHVFLSSPTSNAIVVCDLNGTVLEQITGEPGAMGMWLSDDATSLYVALSTGAAISVIDTSSLSEVARWSTGPIASTVRFVGSAGGRLWFSYTSGNYGAVATGSLDPGDPMAVDYTETTLPAEDLAFATTPALPGTLFVGGRDLEPSTVERLDAAVDPPTVSTSGQSGAQVRDMAVTPDGQQVFVASGAPYQLQVLDAGTLQTSSFSYQTGPYPDAVSISNDGRYVAAGIDGTPSSAAVWPVGSPMAIHAYSYTGTMADAGVRFSGDDSRLFAVTTDVYGHSPTLYVSYSPTSALPCNLSLGITSSASGAVTLGGTLTDVRGTAASGQAVHINRTDPTGGTESLPDSITSTSGAYSFSDSPPAGGLSSYTATAATPANGPNCTASFSVDGQGRTVPAVTLWTSPNPSSAGETVTMSASVVPQSGAPTGTVTFMDGTTALTTASVDANGEATADLSTLTVGDHTLSAHYNGDSSNASVTSSTVTQTIDAVPTAVDIISSTNPSVPTQHVTFAAEVFTPPGAATPTGTVSFQDGNSVIGTAELDANGDAYLTTDALAAGSHSITASYAGDGNDLSAMSDSLTQVVATASSDQRFVNQLYNDILGRPADSGAGAWAAALDAGRVNRTQVALALSTSTEYLSDEVQAAYEGHLGREPDSSGLAYWVGYLQHGGTVENLVISFLGAPEYFQNAGGTDDAFLSALYQDVLGRDIDPAGRTYWDARLAGGTSPWVVAASVVDSTEAMSNRVTGYYELLLGRDPDAPGLSNWVSMLQHGTRDETLVADLAGSTEYWNDSQAY